MGSGLAEIEVLKAVGVLATGAFVFVSSLLWRFEQIARRARQDGAAARSEFLAALKEAAGPRADGGVTWKRGR